MNNNATILFSAFDSSINEYTRSIVSLVRKSLSTEALSPEQNQALEAAIELKLQSFTWSLLCPLDNVGCSLPDGVLSYGIIAHPSDPAKPDEYKRLPDEDIREGEEDYADMWQDYLASKSASAKQGDQ